MNFSSNAGSGRHSLWPWLSAYLVSILLGGFPPVINHLGWQEVKLNVWVGDPGPAADEPSCFKMGRGSIP